MERETYIVKNDNPRKGDVVERAIAAIRLLAEAGQEFQIWLDGIKRTLDQNAAMWPALTDIAEQVKWPHTRGGNWVIDRMPPKSWKAVLTAAFEQETEMAQGLNGGTVMVGASTSSYSKKKMGDFLTFLHAEGTERGVRWSKKAAERFDEYDVIKRAA